MNQIDAADLEDLVTDIEVVARILMGLGQRGDHDHNTIFYFLGSKLHDQWGYLDDLVYPEKEEETEPPKPPCAVMPLGPKPAQ